MEGTRHCALLKCISTFLILAFSNIPQHYAEQKEKGQNHPVTCLLQNAHLYTQSVVEFEPDITAICHLSHVTFTPYLLSLLRVYIFYQYIFLLMHISYILL